MSIDRALLAKGPAKIGFKSTTLFSPEDITLSIEPTNNDVETSMHGKVDEATNDIIAKMPFTPFGNWAALAVLFPSIYLNPTIGGRIMGSSDSPLTLLSNNGDL